MPSSVTDKIKSNFDSTLATLREKSSNKEFFDKFVATLKIQNCSGNNINLLAKNNFAKQVILNDFINEITRLFNSYENTNYELREEINRNNTNIREEMEEMNLDINNLILVSKREDLIMNNHHLFYEDKNRACFAGNRQ
mgnify:CR=1 FL=1